MQAGDHLVSPRPGFTHHGLYVGNLEVIHYAGYSAGEESGQIVLTSLDTFTNGHPCHIVDHALRRYSHEESIDRAWSRLGEANYSALLNNCEHFVTWCVQGFHYSAQIHGLIETSIFISKQTRQHLPCIPLETMAVTHTTHETALVAAVASALPSTTPQTVAIVATGLAAAGAAPLAATAVVGGIALYGAKKHFDWLTD